MTKATNVWDLANALGQLLFQAGIDGNGAEAAIFGIGKVWLTASPWPGERARINYIRVFR